MCICISICTYVYMYICIYVYMYICIYVYVYVYVCVYMYVTIYMGVARNRGLSRSPPPLLQTFVACPLLQTLVCRPLRRVLQSSLHWSQGGFVARPPFCYTPCRKKAARAWYKPHLVEPLPYVYVYVVIISVYIYVYVTYRYIYTYAHTHAYICTHTRVSGTAPVPVYGPLPETKCSCGSCWRFSQIGSGHDPTKNSTRHGRPSCLDGATGVLVPRAPSI